MSGGVDRDPRTHRDESPTEDDEDLSPQELARRREEILRARNKALSPPAPLLVAAFGTAFLSVVLAAVYVFWLKEEDPYASMTYMQTQEFYLVPTTELHLDVRLAPEDRSIGHLTGRVGRFLQSMMVGLDRQRVVAGLTDAEPLYSLTQWDDRHITLRDLVTGERVALESYGSQNMHGLKELLSLADAVREGEDPAAAAERIGAAEPPLSWGPPPGS
ncbi:photosynthetic complex assembly protein PuhC [uncultured Rhodospira sp.]|uniref:photosynthetic complex assembly protein PuhC n=1 Tax=uncultured Rhodospira sp. TaxID=1936189 RepID=UPI002614AADA|nr:photosynthetic complex assembly protein PuhC [uncultured Rhodospira sp.]